MSDAKTQEHLFLTPGGATSLLVDRVRMLAAGHPGRLAVGLAGGPGAGKSTIAQQMVDTLNAGAPGTAAYVPMDGFHMKQAKLEALGIAADKGMPHTFEGGQFAAFLARLKAATGPVSGPAYSRQVEDVVEDAFSVPGPVSILVVEGNYLLLPEAPWAAVTPLLDFSAFIDLGWDKVWHRLMKRHAEAGLFSEARNRAHIARVDKPNYDLIATTAARADLVIELSSEK